MSFRMLNNNLKILECQHNESIDERFHQLNVGNIANVIYWNSFFEKTLHIPGDIVECGIGRGRSILIIAVLNELYGRKRKIFGYDSFLDFLHRL